MPCSDVDDFHYEEAAREEKMTSQKLWVWGEEQETAFRCLKGILSLPPVLSYADSTLLFEFHADASVTVFTERKMG